MEIRCPDCGTRNRIPDERARLGAWACGRCCAYLPVPRPARQATIQGTADHSNRESETPESASLPRATDVWDLVRDQASRAARVVWDRAGEWLGLKPPRPRPVVWLDRSFEAPPCPPHVVGRTDPLTGETIKATDKVFVCSHCDSAFLAATWLEVSRHRGNRCPVCDARGGVKV